MKVIFHVNDPERWGIAARNAKNTLTYYKEQQQPCQIALVATGAAVRQLQKADAQKAGLTTVLEQMVQDGMMLYACSDSMQMQHIEPQDLLDFVNVVPVGAVQMIELQSKGYAYLKP